MESLTDDAVDTKHDDHESVAYVVISVPRSSTFHPLSYERSVGFDRPVICTHRITLGHTQEAYETSVRNLIVLTTKGISAICAAVDRFIQTRDGDAAVDLVEEVIAHSNTAAFVERFHAGMIGEEGSHKVSPDTISLAKQQDRVCREISRRLARTCKEHKREGPVVYITKSGALRLIKKKVPMTGVWACIINA